MSLLPFPSHSRPARPPVCRADEALTRAARFPQATGAVGKAIRDELLVVREELKRREASFSKGFSAAFASAAADGGGGGVGVAPAEE